MLLGSSKSPERVTKYRSIRPSDATNDAETPEAAMDLDVLHATSAALIESLREVLLDSDFENAMKALTSWIPIKDEDMLMNVVRAEWRQHRAKMESKKV